MYEKLKRLFKKLPEPRWHFVIAFLSLCVAISIPLYFLPNLTKDMTHQNVIDYLKTQFPTAQNYETGSI